MKAQFLKLAGVKNEKEFYKKFPTEESFMAKYGAVLKAQYGDQIPPMVDTSLGTVAGGANRFNLNRFGMQNQTLPQGIGYEQQNYFAKQNPFDYNATSKTWAKNNPAVGNSLPESIGYNADLGAKRTIDTKKGFQTGIGFLDKTIAGFKALKAEKKALKNARIWRDVSGVARKASETVDVDARNQIYDTAARTRKALMPTITGEELYPVDGVGTNVLAKHGKKFQSGGEIMNTFAPGDIYQDLAYEPLEESSLDYTPISDDEIVKAYRSGGLIPRFQDGGGMGGGFNFGSMFSGMMGGGSGGSGGGMGGMFGGMMGGGGSGGASGGGGSGMGGMYSMIGNQASGMIGSSMDNNAGTQIGSGIGEGIGSIFGPVGGMIGNIVGTAAGGLLDKNPGKTKRAHAAMMGNMRAMTGMENVKGVQSAYSGSLKDGGYMSWENPNPRVITHFGGQNLSKLLAHANDDMDTLRSGGNIRSNEVGDIEALSGGYLEPISYNPYTAGTGITSMIQGQSHDESNGRHSGVILDYNGNQVEAERGEPISERQDGGSVGETSAVIAGDQTFNKFGAMLIPELREFEGMKVKNIQKKLAKEDAKLNKLQTKNTKALNEFEPKTQIDKITFNSLAMNEEGTDIRYGINAKKAEHLLSYQDANNRTAEKLKVNAGDLTRGKITPIEDTVTGKNGVKLFTQAQDGKTIYDDMEEGFTRGGEKPELTLSQKKAIQRKADAAREEQRKLIEEVRKNQAGRKKGNYVFPQPSPEHKAAQAKKQAAANEAIKQMTTPFNFGTPEVDFTKPVTKSTAKQTPAKKQAVMKQPQNTVQYDNLGRPITETFEEVMAKATAAKQRTPKPAPTSVEASEPVQQAQAKVQQVGEARQAVNLPPVPAAPSQATDDYVSEFGLTAWGGNKYGLGAKTKSSFSTKEWDDIAKNLGFTGRGNKEFQEFLLKHPESKPLIEARHKELYGKEPFIDEKLGYGWAADALKGLRKATPTAPAATPAEQAKNYDVTGYQPSGLETLAAQLMPWLRKTPWEPLSGDQLAGEMFALAQNKVEPVQARFYHPQLDVPYDISLQDQLNENQADFNALQRRVGSNPEALAALAGQKYMANSKVLAEQFRLNQAKKDQVYSANRATLNDALLKNLAIADKQYERQSLAKSNTKEIFKGALDSVAAKIAQNRLENRQLQVGSNEFDDFSYDKNMRLRKTGAPESWNIPQMYGPGAGDITHVPVYDKDGNPIGYQQIETGKQPSLSTQGINPAIKTSKSRNGSLVKAFKNL